MDKKQYNSIWAGSLALLLLAGSCSKSDETAAPEPSDGRIVVRALASDSGQAPSFDRFGLYIVQKAAEGSEALAGERLHEVAFSFCSFKFFHCFVFMFVDVLLLLHAGQRPRNVTSTASI